MHAILCNNYYNGYMQWMCQDSSGTLTLVYLRLGFTEEVRLELTFEGRV